MQESRFKNGTFLTVNVIAIKIFSPSFNTNNYYKLLSDCTQIIIYGVSNKKIKNLNQWMKSVKPLGNLENLRGIPIFKLN